MTNLNHLSLFTGIGGLDLAAEWAGFKTVGQVEIDDYCNKVLEKHWHDVPRWRDVYQLTGEEIKKKCGTVDVISAGFPCPAFSMSGKRGGFEQDRLFYEATRICAEVEPPYIVFENVAGFTKWRHSLHEEIESIGYEWADYVLDARDFGIPQARRRYFAVCFRRGMLFGSQHLRRIQREEGQDIHRLQPYTENSEGRWSSTVGSKEEWRTIFSACRKSRDVDGVSNRMDRLRCLGNAVIPQQAYPVFKTIAEMEEII